MSPDGQQVAVMVVGDAVLEPFWPEGLGINRGFHTALDAVGCEEMTVFLLLAEHSTNTANPARIFWRCVSHIALADSALHVLGKMY